MAIVGSYALSLNKDERKELGSALYETLEDFPASSPVVKTVNAIGPWSIFGEGMARAIWTRVQYVSIHRKRPAPPLSGFAPQQTEVVREQQRDGSVVETPKTTAQPTPPNLGNRFLDEE